MANSSSAKKQVKQNEKRRIKNMHRETAIKTAIKKVINAHVSKESVEVVQQLLREAESKLARAALKNTMHKNTVRRKISRLARFVIPAAA